MFSQSSGIVLSPMEIPTFSKVTFLRYSEIVLSPLEGSRFLKINVFASSGIVLSPLEIKTFSKIAFLRYSEIVLSPMQRNRLLKIYVSTSSDIVFSPAAMHHRWHRISCNAEHLKKSFTDQCWEADFCMSKCKRNSTLNPFQY